MVKLFNKPYRWAVVFSVLLMGAFAYALLGAFVIPRAMIQTQEQQSVVTPTETGNSVADLNVAVKQTTKEPIITATSYEDENIKITIETQREYDTTFYVADIQLSGASYLKTAFAENTYGRNIRDTTSDMAEAADAIFAINGDYYGFRDKGFVLRNGVLYRETSNNVEALVIDQAGNFSIVNESDMNTRSQLDNGAWQIFSFGPTLVQNGEIMVDNNTKASKAKTDNPRTAIGQVSELRYVVIVADGRTRESDGMTLMELAEQFAKRGCTIAYNLDGGGSSTMYFNGAVVNVPADGESEKQRKVSDIVYIGYK